MILLPYPISDCKYFTWHEALFLPTWKVHVHPEPKHVPNIIDMAYKMDEIRDIIGHPIHVTSWYRPKLYNLWKKPYGVGGAGLSAHMEGLAVDFVCSVYNADEIRELLLPKLEGLSIRMENLPGSSWVHVDLRKYGYFGRYFTP